MERVKTIDDVIALCTNCVSTETSCLLCQYNIHVACRHYLLSDIKLELIKIKKEIDEKDDKIRDLEAQVSSLSDMVAKLENENADLRAKNIAINDTI